MRALFNGVAGGPRARSVLGAYCLHLLVFFPVALFLGHWVEFLAKPLYSGNPTITTIGPCAAVVAGFAGFALNSQTRRLCASFVFLLPLLLFLEDWHELAQAWSPSGRTRHTRLTS
jgi:hypothetical protein